MLFVGVNGFNDGRKLNSNLPSIPTAAVEENKPVANIDAEYRYNNEILTERITAMKDVRLEVLEITANRIKLEVVQIE